MTRRKIAAELCKLEGGKSQARMGDLQQVLKLLVQMDAEYVLKGMPSPLDALSEEADALVQDPKFKKKHLPIVEV